MSEIKDDVHSSHLREPIEKLAEQFYDEIKKSAYFDCVYFNPENVGKAFEHYRAQILPRIKEKMLEKDGEFIDRHKIIAGYTESFLAEPVFAFKEPEQNRERKYGKWICKPNIAFIAVIIQEMLESFIREARKSEDYSMRFPERIYNHYSEEITTFADHLSNLLNSFDSGNEKFSVFTFSMMLAWLEGMNDCAFYNGKNFYYSFEPLNAELNLGLITQN